MNIEKEKDLGIKSKITVVIPTANRPDLLKAALLTVSEQTYAEYIDQVIVSENGLNRSSETICKEFFNLHINYIYQESQKSILDHFQWLLSQESKNYVALLCDDDCWDINHLELAIKNLDKNNSSISYFSNFIYIKDENSLKLTASGNLNALHFGLKSFKCYKPIHYNLRNILLFSILTTPFHYSSMVCRGEALVKAVTIFPDLHPTYADRILWVELAKQGNLIFNPLITTWIRSHEGMDTYKYNTNEWRNASQKASLEILNQSDNLNFDIRGTLNELYRMGNDDEREFILNVLKYNFVDISLLDWFFDFNKLNKEDESKIISLKRKIINKMKYVVKRQ